MSFNTSISIRGLTRVYDVPGRDDARVVALDHVDAVFRRPSFIRNKTKQGRARYFIVWVNRKTVRIAEILFLVSQTLIRIRKLPPIRVMPLSVSD